ncbi:hypothetical protein [Acuticoccus kandeliae]|uniref:hypothetical protein n=1 Tax=Acuticoccus kandeliae TaxID=2073160 RepID=UPI0013003631|nr:hypothetical protein [Acuticoccus kandeliae]
MPLPAFVRPGRHSTARDLMRVFAATVWVGEFLNLVFGWTVAGAISAVALCGFLVLSATRLDPFTRGGAIFLVFLGIVSVALGADPWRGLERLWMATLIASFLMMLVLLRCTIGAHPALEMIRRKFVAIDKGDRSGGIILVNHLLGSVLMVGVMSFFAPLIGDAPHEERRRAAELSIRGVALIIMWSPFTVGMATVTTSLTNVPFWQIASVGAVITLAAFLASLALGEIRLRPDALGKILVAVQPILLPLCGITIVILLLARVWDRPALAAATLLLLPFCLAWTRFMGPGTTKSVVHATFGSLDRLSSELTLFTLAIVLAGLILDIPALASVLHSLSERHLPLYPLIMAGGLLIGLVPVVGVHMIVPATIVLAIYQDIGTGSHVEELILAIHVLLGWCFGSLVGLGSLSLLTASTVYRIPRSQLVFGNNLAFLILLFAAVSLGGGLAFALAR